MCAKSNLVGHCARREEERGLLSSYLRDMCFEGNGCGFMVDIITKGCKRCIQVHFLGRNWVVAVTNVSLRRLATTENAYL